MSRFRLIANSIIDHPVPAAFVFVSGGLLVFLAYRMIKALAVVLEIQ
jgi:hypothetical protein